MVDETRNAIGQFNAMAQNYDGAYSEYVILISTNSMYRLYKTYIDVDGEYYQYLDGNMSKSVYETLICDALDIILEVKLSFENEWQDFNSEDENSSIGDNAYAEKANKVEYYLKQYIFE